MYVEVRDSPHGIFGSCTRYPRGLTKWAELLGRRRRRHRRHLEIQVDIQARELYVEFVPLSGLFFGGSIEKNQLLKWNSRAPPLHSESCDSPRAQASGENFGNFTPKSGLLLESRGPKLEVSPSVCGREASGKVLGRFL